MKTATTPPRFAIVNESDRPCPNNVVEFLPSLNSYAYLVPRSGDKHPRILHDLDPAGATSMEDFGFEVKVTDKYVSFLRTGPSHARYHDRSLREWQELSKTTFTLTLVGAL